MQNWEVVQKKISEMSKEEFIKFATQLSLPQITHILNSNKKCGADICCDIGCCDSCKNNYLLEVYQPPKQEKWIVHRTLKMNGMETYVGYSDDNVDDGCRKYFLGTFDGKNICGYLHKLKAHKFDYLEAIVLREQLNKQRAYKQYLWVISHVEE